MKIFDFENNFKLNKKTKLMTFFETDNIFQINDFLVLVHFLELANFFFEIREHFLNMQTLFDVSEHFLNTVIFLFLEHF